MVHDLHTGPLRDAQLPEVLLGHDAQRRKINLRVAENVEVLDQPDLVQQLLHGAFQGAQTGTAASAPAPTRDATPAAAAAHAQAAQAAGEVAGVKGKAVRFSAAEFAGAAAACPSLRVLGDVT